MKIISINNNKGGVLKTTIATNIAAALSKDKKALLVDLDPQGNVCLAFGQLRTIKIYFIRSSFRKRKN